MFFCISVSGTYAQSHAPNFHELIIELPVINAEKSLNSVVFGLVGMGGIRYEGYCSQMKCIMLSVDENIYPDEKEIMITLKELNTPFIIKPTGKIALVKEACKDPIVFDPEPLNNYQDK